MPAGPPEPVRVAADAAQARLYANSLIAACDRTMTRATTFTENQLQTGVDGEWSTVESLRHLVLVTDLWLSKVVLGQEDPLHPIALPPHFAPAAAISAKIDTSAAPSFSEAAEVLRDRLRSIRAAIDGLGDADLGRPVATHAKNVAGALAVLFDEFAAHDGFINRDLDKIAGV